MAEALGIIGLIVAIIAAVFAYLQWNHPKVPNNLSLSPNHNGVILKRVLETKVIRVGFFHYPPLIDYDEPADNVVANQDYMLRFSKASRRSIPSNRMAPTQTL